MVYDVLTDPRKRQIYDDSGEKGIKGARNPDSDDEEGGTCTCCCAAAAAANAAAANADFEDGEIPFGFRFPFPPGSQFSFDSRAAYESFIYSRMAFFQRMGGRFPEDGEVVELSESESDDDEIDDDDDEEEVDEDEEDEGVQVSEVA